MTLTRCLCLLTLLTLTAGAGRAEEVLLELDWRRLDAADLALSGGTVVETDRGWSALRIDYRGEEPTTLPLLRLTDPGITGAHYAISGQVRYESVPGDSYLEMWNVMPGGGRFFSRTLGSMGPSRTLNGSSDWRLFLLPAYLQDSPERPQALELNLALFGPATVEIGPLTLTQLAPGENAADVAAGAWWSTRIGALLGAFGGSGLGVVAAVLGILIGTGRARPLVTAFGITLLAAGLAALAFGVVAYVGDQPYPVYYPLLLLGGLTAAVMFVLLVVQAGRYRQLEMRRMRAMDAS